MKREPGGIVGRAYQTQANNELVLFFPGVVPIGASGFNPYP